MQTFDTNYTNWKWHSQGIRVIRVKGFIRLFDLVPREPLTRLEVGFADFSHCFFSTTYSIVTCARKTISPKAVADSRAETSAGGEKSPEPNAGAVPPATPTTPRPPRIRLEP